MVVPHGYEGLWRVSRRIVPFDGGPVWRFVGTAEIRHDRFVEDGAMSAGGPTMPARRCYGLDRSSPGTLSVSRQDGSPFVDIGQTPEQRLAHLCGQDHYRGRLWFIDADRWMEVWRVRGPRKHYRSVARFTRA